MNSSDGSEDDGSLSSSSLSKASRGVKANRFGKSSNLDNNIHGLNRAEVEKEYEDLRALDMNGSGLRRSGQMPDGRFSGRGEKEGFRSSQMIDIERKMYSASSDSVGGSSKNYLDFRYGESSQDGYVESRFNMVEYTGDDRAELLKKIDELKAQLNRSGEMANKPISKNPRHGWNAQNDHYYNASQDRFSDSSSGINRPFVQHPFPDNHPGRASYTNQYLEPSVYIDVHGVGSRHSVYPNGNPRSHIVPVHRYSGIPPNRVPNHLGNSVGMHVSHDYDLGVPKMPQLQSFNLQTHPRFASEVDSEVSNFDPVRPPKIQPSTSKHYCRAIAAGAPFITCKICFELLRVPTKVMVQNGVKRKMRCGPCSSILVLHVSNKGLFVYVNESMKEGPPVTDDRQLIEGNSHAQGQQHQASMTLSSEDYDHSGYEFQSLDREVVPQIIHQPSFTKTGRSKIPQSSSSSTSEEVANLDPMAASLKCSNPSEFPITGKPTSPDSGSSFLEFFEHSNKYHRGDRFMKGNKSRGSDPVSLVPNKTTSIQNSMKDASEVSEIDVSTNEYGNTVTSLDSEEQNEEAYQLGAQNAALLAGIIKKSFEDPKSNPKDEQEKTNVTVNGSLLPVGLIKNAEKVAGPIQPGNYWYDIQAGFWGVMGGPCRGIIPPFIEEFNHFMPENCAGGNTRVFVNGRELHQTDFNLLVKRGLPNERNRSYNIEISGRVLDAETGEELECLGKLAPTVEKLKHGFGMKPPKASV